MSKKEKPKYNWRAFSILKSDKDLAEYLAERTYRHQNFFHYASVDKIDSIVGGHSFWLSDVKGFNDKKDIEQFKDGLYYSLCFSTGIRENLPLWYLYSGNSGKGARIGFTEKNFKIMIDNAEFTLCRRRTNKKGKMVGGIKEPIKLDDSLMEKKVGDVVYFGKKSKDAQTMDLKYNTMTNYDNIFETDFNKFRSACPGFCKGLIWYYEKETRIVIKLKKDAEKIIENDKKEAEKEKRNKDDKIVYFVKMSVREDAWNSMKITLAPEIDKISVGYSDYPHIKDFMEITSSLKLSKHAGELEINLCRDCNDKNIVESIKEKACADCTNPQKCTPCILKEI